MRSCWTDISTIDLNRATVSDRVSYSRANHWQYILGYGVDEEMIILLSMKTPKNIFRAIMYLSATRAQLIQNDSAFLRPQIGGFKHLERGWIATIWKIDIRLFKRMRWMVFCKCGMDVLRQISMAKKFHMKYIAKEK